MKRTLDLSSQEDYNTFASLIEAAFKSSSCSSLLIYKYVKRLESLISEEQPQNNELKQ